MENGTVWAWGANEYGQLGDGTTMDRATPVQVIGFDDVDIVEIAVGSEHNLALTSDGKVWAWGRNTWGQLGDGTRVGRTVPVPIPGMMAHTTTAISAGLSHNLAVTGSTGIVVTWGEHSNRNNITPAPIIVQVGPNGQMGPMANVTVVSAGGDHSLALRTNGSISAWGANGNGQLGDGTTINRFGPVSAIGLTSGVTAISAGFNHSLALRNDGTVRAWGLNSSGQLGDGTTTQRLSPVQVEEELGVPLSDVTSIAAGDFHSLATKDDRTAWAWGGNIFGMLGDNTNVQKLRPVPVMGLIGIADISAGHTHSLASRSDGTAWAWGCNWYGQLGNGTNDMESRVPVRVRTMRLPGHGTSDDPYLIYTAADLALMAELVNAEDANSSNTSTREQIAELLIEQEHKIESLRTGAIDTITDQPMGSVSASDTVRSVERNQLEESIADIEDQLVQLARTLNTEGVTYGNAHYKLVNDINLSAYGANFNGGRGWVPIGSHSTPFMGVFDGNGKTVSRLYINDFSASNIGLFGVVIDSTVKNLGVSDADVRGIFYVGGIVGAAWGGSIEYCSFAGSVTGIFSVGGIVGRNWGSVSNSYSTGDVAGEGSGNGEIGGIAGHSGFEGSITNCYATGTISGSRIGGIVGRNKGTVSNCYATGKIYGEGWSEAGGIAGWNDGGSVINCAALNPSVGDTVGTYGRVVGFNLIWQVGLPSHLSDNVAFSDMIITKTLDIGHDKVDGECISHAELKADGTIGGRFTPPIWTTEDGKLPGFGETVDMLERPRIFDIFEVEENQVYTIAITAENIATFDNITYTLEYDPNILQLLDFAAQTPTPVTAVGSILGTPLEILSHANGVLTFRVDRTVPNGFTWSGVLTVTRFKALASGNAAISVG
jgi:alpha-tubulin suppressor-like RCC1 family protein